MTAPSAPTMSPRTVAAAVMDLKESASATIVLRDIAAAAMNWRESAFAIVYHYLYNEPGVAYNQAGFQYNYNAERGLIDPRIVGMPTMEGRL